MESKNLCALFLWKGSDLWTKAAETGMISKIMLYLKIKIDQNVLPNVYIVKGGH